MKEVEFRYGFPLFTTARSTVNLLKLERNRVSDIWSFWDYLIKQHLKRNGKTMETFLSSLHEQSMYFYKAAEQAPIRSQPLLYYYSFLNLAKIFLCLTEGLDSTKVYQLGIRTTVDVLTTLDLKREVERSEKVLLQKHRNITAGRVIAELNFGFWNSLFETHHYALLKGVPGTIFKSLPTGTGRKEINLRVQQIRNLRNRISHNEPLCFKDKAFDLAYVNEMYIMISDFLKWIDPQIINSLGKENLDRVSHEINETTSLL